MARKRVVSRFSIGKKRFFFRYPTFKDLEDRFECINSLVEEKEKLIIQKKRTRKEVRQWMQRLSKEVRNKNSVALVVEVDGKVMGGCEIGRDSHQNMGHVGQLGIALAKEIRGIGVGCKIIRKIISEAKRVLKIKIVLLEVFGSNSIAQRVYRKCGFEFRGVIRRGVKFYGRYDDRLEMIKYI